MGYALFEKANLRAGQSVLIHAGTGGIGHSAIHLCLQRGITVFATCAHHKREYLASLGVPLERIGSSRDPSFHEMILRQTSGVGVDCVLNSLSGEMLDASLEVVADFGHFCEIGKVDLQNNTRLGLKALEKNVSYHAVDLATMFDHPRLSLVLKTMMQDMLDKKEVKPLPCKVFPAAQAVDALRFMAGSKHMGKVLIKMTDFQPDSLVQKYQARGVHIITGGLGGFGMELARWLLQSGASQVVLTSRSGLRTSWQRFRYNSLVSAYGRDAVTISTRDVCDVSQASQLIAESKMCGEVRGVWHSAMVLKDTLFKNMSQADWDAVHDSKATALVNLDRASQEAGLELDSSVAFSSVSSLLGNMGQSNYALANNACERVVEERRRHNLPGTAVQWGQTTMLVSLHMTRMPKLSPRAWERSTWPHKTSTTRSTPCTRSWLAVPQLCRASVSWRWRQVIKRKTLNCRWNWCRRKLRRSWAVAHRTSIQQFLCRSTVLTV